MCGLLGFLSNDGTAKEVRDDLAAALDLCRHRGPDEAGTWHDDDVVFGFNRLSIIDIEHSPPAAALGPPERRSGTRWCSTARSTTTSNCASELADELGALFDTEGDGEAIVAALPLLGRGSACPGCAGCSRS